MTDISGWGLSGTYREPTPTELADGYDCGTPPQALFNWLDNVNLITASRYYRSVEAIQNDPPGAPTNGQSWIVGDTPTGAWVGKADFVATWVGDDWVFSAPTPWMHVGLADRTDWRWDHTLGTPAWVEWKATADYAGPINLSETLRLALVFPEIDTADHKLAITDNADGTLTINAGQTWLWRGHRQFSTDDFDVADRTVTTVANKTYHVRWHAPGTGTATPEATYPNGRFELADMTALTEGDAQYDSTYDRMLVAYLETDGANAATVVPLANAVSLFMEGETFLTGIAWAGDIVAPSAMTGGTLINLSFARTPVASMGMMTSISTKTTSDTIGTQQINVGVVTRNRYQGLVTYQKTENPQSGYVSWSFEA